MRSIKSRQLRSWSWSGFFGLLMGILTACNPPVPSEQRPNFPPTEQLSQGSAVEAYANMLRRRVNRAGEVHYAGIQSDDKALRAYLLYLQQRYPLVKDAPAGVQTAFWINAHNAAVLQLVVQHYPIRSVLDIGREEQDLKAPDYGALMRNHPNHPFLLPVLHLDGRDWSIQQMHDRAFELSGGDQRILFLLTDGTASSPQLLKEPVAPEALNEALDHVVESFLTAPTRNPSLNPNRLRLSGYLERYKEAWTSEKALIEFVNAYIPVDVSVEATVEYLPYQYELNGY